LVGRGTLSFGGKSYELHRKDLFRDRPDIVYLPPKTSYTLETIDALEIALGGAPAEGKLPARIIPHDQIATAVRGGANAKRGVSTLADSYEFLGGRFPGLKPWAESSSPVGAKISRRQLSLHRSQIFRDL
jgi:5-deoxy-D-glucuronate isomerase